MGVTAEATAAAHAAFADEFGIGDHPALRNYYENLRHAPWTGSPNLEYGQLKQQTAHWPATKETPSRLVIEVTNLKSFIESTEGPVFFWADTIEVGSPVCVMTAKGEGHGELLVTLAIKQSPSAVFATIHQEIANICKGRKRIVACGLPRLLGSVGKPFTPTMLVEESAFWVETRELRRGRLSRLVGGLRNIFRRPPTPQFPPQPLSPRPLPPQPLFPIYGQVSKEYQATKNVVKSSFPKGPGKQSAPPPDSPERAPRKA